MVKFSEIIENSFEWTITQLFRPFRLKKWMLLAFCALCAGALSYQSINLNLPFDRESRSSSEQAGVGDNSRAESEDTLEAGQGENLEDGIAQLKNWVVEFKEKPYALPVVALVVLLAVGLLVFTNWLYSCFAFVFLENVVANDASIRIPFRNNKTLGNSYFLFNLIFSGIYLLLFSAVVWQSVRVLRERGVLAHFEQSHPVDILLMLLPYLLILIGVGVAAMIVKVLVNDLVVVVMYRERKALLPALARAGAFIGGNVRDLGVYLLIKIGLSLAAGMAYGIATLLSLLGLLLPLAVIGLLAALGMNSVPQAYQWVVITAAVIAAIPVILAMQIFFLCLQLPIAVFFRTLSVKFIGRMNPAWDLFNRQTARGGGVV